MIHEPERRISERALSVWRITGMISTIVSALVAAGLTAMTVFFSWPVWIPVVAFVVVIIEGYLFIYLFPMLRWRRWRYDVREQEIELQQGIVVVKRTLVPMVRVQHVDTVQGPLLKKYDLATVTISTAATVHEIPALPMAEAEELRVFISTLARVADEDV